jgi:hypothetical protein
MLSSGPQVLITSLHSKSYLLSGMLINRQNSYAPRGKQRTGLREAQNREPVNKLKELSLYSGKIKILPL